jgi:predicted nuclease of predicted toxin-antitoxin system
MRLLADEGVDRPIVERLRRDGHEVRYVAEESPGMRDPEILQDANDGGSVLMTADRDFGELVFRQGRLHAGVILLRLAGLSAATKAELVAKAIRDHEDRLRASFCVITHGAVRIRRSP